MGERTRSSGGSGRTARSESATGEEFIYTPPSPESLRRVAGRPLPQTDFKAALTKLASDKGYRDGAIADPAIIARDFKLSLKDLQALRQVALLSGADVTKVNELRAAEMAAQIDGLSAADVDVSCCSCCCCCCGETAVVPMTAA